MTNKEIDDILKSTPAEVDSSFLANIEKSMLATLAPVRPMMPPWVLTSCLIALCGIIPATGAAILGFQGVQRLGAERISLIFSALCLFSILAAILSVGEMIPGRGRIVDPRTLLAISVLVLLALFVSLFQAGNMSRFIPKGIACLEIGLLVAIPTALASWLILRRGFAVNARAAGLATGTLGGLAGVIALELHCPNFGVLHVAIWHTAVIPISALAGALAGHFFARK
jgi:hypothetical protein